jgi:transcriptional regulator with XRE-family HTH domain
MPKPTRDEVLAARLRQCRAVANLTQQDVADRMRFEHRAIVSNLETGRRSVKVTELMDLARLYKVSPDSLLEGL